MHVKVVTHKTGEQIPIMLDAHGMPITLPNEFVLSRRALSTNTLVRNLRELSVLYDWLEVSGCDLLTKLLAQNSFNEAELKGGLVESLRVDKVSARVKAISPNTFNQRLTTVRLIRAVPCRRLVYRLCIGVGGSGSDGRSRYD